MPLKSGNSHQVVSSNIKELVKSGRPVKQAIAISLANKRKFKKMAEGGLVNADFDEEGTPEAIDSGDEDTYQTSAPSGGATLSYEPMEEGEDEHRSLTEIDEDGDYHPSEVANPMQQDEARSFAEAMRRQFAKGGEVGMNFEEEGDPDLREDKVDIDYSLPYANGGEVFKENKKLEKVPMKDRFAMGGLVEDPGEVQDTVGAKPEEDMSDSIEDKLASLRAEKAQLGHYVRNETTVGSPKPPRDLGISEEAMEAIRNKRMKRRYPQF